MTRWRIWSYGATANQLLVEPQVHWRPLPRSQQTQPRAPPLVVVFEATQVAPAVVQGEFLKGALSVPSAEPAAVQVVAAGLIGRFAPPGGLQASHCCVPPVQTQGRTPRFSIPQAAHPGPSIVHAALSLLPDVSMQTTVPEPPAPVAPPAPPPVPVAPALPPPVPVPVAPALPPPVPVPLAPAVLEAPPLPAVVPPPPVVPPVPVVPPTPVVPADPDPVVPAVEPLEPAAPPPSPPPQPVN
jgi:hypothetical protein